MPSVMFAQDQTPLPPAVDTTIVVEGITDTAYGSNNETSHNTRFDTLTGIAAVQVRKIPDSVIRRLQNNDDYWYAQQPPPRQEQKKETVNSGWKLPSWVRQLLWFVLLGGFISLIAWFLWTSKAGLFSRKPVLINDIPEEEEDIHTINFELEKQKALTAGNYRLAARLWYLQTLKHLADKNIIHYSQEKTNRDYVEQLFGTDQYQVFFQLTRHFEYTWYGQFPLSHEDYEKLAASFSKFNRHLLT